MLLRNPFSLIKPQTFHYCYCPCWPRSSGLWDTSHKLFVYTSHDWCVLDKTGRASTLPGAFFAGYKRWVGPYLMGGSWRFTRQGRPLCETADFRGIYLENKFVRPSPATPLSFLQSLSVSRHIFHGSIPAVASRLSTAQTGQTETWWGAADIGPDTEFPSQK